MSDDRSYTDGSCGDSQDSSLSPLLGQDDERYLNDLTEPLQWARSMMEMGCNPRRLLFQLTDGEIDVPHDANEFTVWKIILELISEPEPRDKLPHYNTIEDVVSLIQRSSKILIITGAGISVSCGIPDFRSADGIYSRLKQDYPLLRHPTDMFSLTFFKSNPLPFFKFAKEIYPGLFSPSTCHRFIAVLESEDRLLRNYTQNIDTLEQIAGISKLVQCHGSFATATCLQCRSKTDCESIRSCIMEQRIPKCLVCKDSVVKPDIVFFGEPLSDHFHNTIDMDKDQCDLLIVIGSSMKVKPVATIPHLMGKNVPQILINREPLPQFNFDVELLGNCDDIIVELSRRLGGLYARLADGQPLLTESLKIPKPCPEFLELLSSTSMSTATSASMSTTNSAYVDASSPTTTNLSVRPPELSVFSNSSDRPTDIHLEEPVVSTVGSIHPQANSVSSASNEPIKKPAGPSMVLCTECPPNAASTQLNNFSLNGAPDPLHPPLLSSVPTQASSTETSSPSPLNPCLKTEMAIDTGIGLYNMNATSSLDNRCPTESNSQSAVGSKRVRPSYLDSCSSSLTVAPGGYNTIYPCFDTSLVTDSASTASCPVTRPRKSRLGSSGQCPATPSGGNDAGIAMGYGGDRQTWSAAGGDTLTCDVARATQDGISVNGVGDLLATAKDGNEERLFLIQERSAEKSVVSSTHCINDSNLPINGQRTSSKTGSISSKPLWGSSPNSDASSTVYTVLPNSSMLSTCSMETCLTSSPELSGGPSLLNSECRSEIGGISAQRSPLQATHTQDTLPQSTCIEHQSRPLPANHTREQRRPVPFEVSVLPASQGNSSFEKGDPGNPPSIAKLDPTFISVCKKPCNSAALDRLSQDSISESGCVDGDNAHRSSYPARCHGDMASRNCQPAKAQSMPTNSCSGKRRNRPFAVLPPKGHYIRLPGHRYLFPGSELDYRSINTNPEELRALFQDSD